MGGSRSIRTVSPLSPSNKECPRCKELATEYLHDRILLEGAVEGWETHKINFTITMLNSSSLQIIMSQFRILKWTYQMVETLRLTIWGTDSAHLFPTFRKRTRSYYQAFSRLTMGTARTEQTEILIWIGWCRQGARTSSLPSPKVVSARMRGKRI